MKNLLLHPLFVVITATTLRSIATNLVDSCDNFVGEWFGYIEIAFKNEIGSDHSIKSFDRNNETFDIRHIYLTSTNIYNKQSKYIVMKLHIDHMDGPLDLPLDGHCKDGVMNLTPMVRIGSSGDIQHYGPISGSLNGTINGTVISLYTTNRSIVLYKV
jgi:hypothetical protein